MRTVGRKIFNDQDEKMRRVEIELGKIPDLQEDLAALELLAQAASTGLSTAVVGAAIYTNPQTITQNATIAGDRNGFSAGPIAIDSGVSVVIETGGSWVIL